MAVAGQHDVIARGTGASGSWLTAQRPLNWQRRSMLQRARQAANHPYAFSTGLGVVEITIGLLVLGSVLTCLTPVVTLSFLVTTPEAWVANLGDARFGFPYLSGGGRLVLKDVLMLSGVVVMVADSARQVLYQVAARNRLTNS
ncbi:DUF417 family protein [Pseudomonas wayambapalatensis]|uniref:DUF417 family protein n=1 Tax=Pseudomonas wayambapalatensis TaxID=485895 RepID=UPI003CEAB7B7